MVDEATFKRVLKSANPQPCPFDRALLSGCCACSLVDRHYIAERETLVCPQPAAQAACVEVLEQLRQNSVFAIRELRDAVQVTHAHNMKIQCGGLHGLQREVDGADDVADVAALVSMARKRYGAADRFPYQVIVRSVAAWQSRPRHGKE